jgi:hypothetical protein
MTDRHRVRALRLDDEPEVPEPSGPEPREPADDQTEARDSAGTLAAFATSTWKLLKRPAARQWAEAASGGCMLRPRGAVIPWSPGKARSRPTAHRRRAPPAAKAPPAAHPQSRRGC